MLLPCGEQFQMMALGICESFGHYRLFFDPVPANIAQRSVALAHGSLLKISNSSRPSLYGTREMLGIFLAS